MEIIKKILLVFGVLAVCFLLLGSGLMAFFIVQGRRVDQSSKEYADKNIPLIVSAWSQEELLKRASPDLLKNLQNDPGQLSTLFSESARLLGPLQRYQGSQGEAKPVYSLARGTEATAAYVADIACEHGDARIKVALVLYSGQWHVSGFHVASQRFAGSPARTEP